MNRVCPVCKDSLLYTEPVPIEEPIPEHTIGTLHFCSEKCRNKYTEEARDD